MDVPEANVREVAVRLAQGAKMLDVRESHERAICAIRPSTHIPLADVLADPSAAAKRLPDGPVYVYCLGGVRSMQAAKALAAEGVEVINVAGGLKQWWLYVDPSMPRY
ncbi:MAG: rhodanese-like domain-containing protein [Peptidiphaga gingivicola]